MSNTSDEVENGARSDGRPSANGTELRDAAQERLGQAVEKATNTEKQARDKVHGVACACEQFVRERPLRSVFIAAGIGWLLGRFWQRAEGDEPMTAIASLDQYVESARMLGAVAVVVAALYPAKGDWFPWCLPCC